MRIIEMTATFGALHKAVLRPGPGLTLIEAPNESGKSTWCAFLRAMFYGFPARDRDKGGYIAEKNRYQPWSGAPMEGTLTMEWKGRELTLYRGPKGSVPWGGFSAVWTATGEPVPGLTGETCGETLLGVSREVFERTVFVGQGGALLSPSADLEKRVAALATTGEEEVSFSQVERRLKDWLNRRKVNSRVGLIPELEGQLARTEETLARQRELLEQAQSARQERDALDAQRLQLESRLKAHADADRAKQAQRRQQAQAEYDSLAAQAENQRQAVAALPSSEALRQAQGDLAYLNTLSANLRVAENALTQAEREAEEAQIEAKCDPLFGGMDPAQAAEEARADHAQAERLGKKPLSLLSLLGAPAGVVLGTVLFRLINGHFAANLPSLLLGALAGWAIVALPLLLWNKSRKRKLAELVYGKYDGQDIPDSAARYAQKHAAAQQAAERLRSVEAERDKTAAQIGELKDQLLALVHPFAPEVTDPFGVSAALSRALQQKDALTVTQARLEAAEKVLSSLPAPAAGADPVLSGPPPQGDPQELAAQLAALRREFSRAGDDAARLQGELNSLGDPAELEARRGALLEELELRREEYAAIAAALESLNAADSLLRERFSPAVNERAGAYLSALTGGKYTRAAFTRQFQASAQQEGELTARQDLSLSGGTAEQLYLAVRLAMCELTLPQDEPCPIVLDDALDAFDDGRAGLALQCLLRLSLQRQVLLFSCHSRERGMLAGTQARLLSL